MSNFKTYTFTSTDVETAPRKIGPKATLDIDFSTGAGVGTVSVDVRPVGADGYVRDSITYSNVDGNTFKLIDVGASGAEVRVVCTAYTSGTITARIY